MYGLSNRLALSGITKDKDDPEVTEVTTWEKLLLVISTKDTALEQPVAEVRR